MKKSVTNEDGSVQSTIESYVDENVSICKVTVDFKGKSGTMVFTSQDGQPPEISFESEKHSISADEIVLSGNERTIITGNSTLIDAEDDFMISSGNRLDMKALSGIVNLIAAKSMNIGANDDIKIETIKALALIALESIKMEAARIEIKGEQVMIGNSPQRPVARLGDKIVLTSSNSGVIMEGSKNVFVT